MFIFLLTIINEAFIIVNVRTPPSVMLLNKHIKKANKDCETSMGSMYLSRRIDIKKKTNGTLISCFLYVNSHYFERRECISFNADGWIGFAGWADQGNTNPILRAFIEWCDQLAADKEG